MGDVLRVTDDCDRKKTKKFEHDLVISEDRRTFVAITHSYGKMMETMDKTFWEKREAAMKRFLEAKKRKEARVAEITRSLCDEFKERTGDYPSHVDVW